MTLKAEEEAAKRSEGGQRVEAGPRHLRRHEASSSLPPSFLDHHVVLYQRKRINKQVNEQKVEGIQAYILQKKHLVISAPNGTARDSDFQIHHHAIGPGPSLFMEFSRQEYWSGLPFPSPGHLPNPGIKPRSPTTKAHSLLSEPPWNPLSICCCC